MQSCSVSSPPDMLSRSWCFLDQHSTHANPPWLRREYTLNIIYIALFLQNSINEHSACAARVVATSAAHEGYTITMYHDIAPYSEPPLSRWNCVVTVLELVLSCRNYMWLNHSSLCMNLMQ